MPKLTLIRGLPGSGKSTLAKMYNFGLIFEADSFFDRPQNGDYVYDFDVRLIKIAHEWCFSNAAKALRWGYDVAVCNTFTRVWEMQRYFDLVDLIPGLQIEVIEMKTQYSNIHNIPQDKLKDMAERWEPLPVDFQFPIVYYDEDTKNMYNTIVNERDGLKLQIERLKAEVDRLRWAAEEHD